MDEKMKNNQDVLEIDVQRLLGAVVKKAWLIGLVAVVCAILTLLGTLFFVTPEYQATAMFYVNNNSLSLGDASFSISSGDISASRGLVKSYIVILNTRESLNAVIDYADSDLTYGELRGMIAADAVDSTEIFRVVVTSTDPKEAKEIADAIAYVLPKRIASIVEGTSAKVVDTAVKPATPSSPNYTKNTMLGFIVGLVVTSLLVMLREFLDITIRTEDDIARCCAYPVLASVPDMEAHTKGGYYYGYGNTKKAYEKSGSKEPKSVELVGGNISFAAAEAYKLLRTKLQFSFADEGNCRVVGISSALAGEGKSLSAVNLAYTTALLGKRVLLIDCDMRRSSVSEKLPVKRSPGLSDFLSGQSHAEKLIQLCGVKDDERAFHVIAAGRTPPNPIELLSSERMNKMLEHLRENYDYIILDLPPVAEVSDALAVAKFTDGMLVVVRQNYCDRVVLSSAVRQFEFVDVKILGMVFNSTIENGGISKKYYKRYYSKYGRSYEAAAKAGKLNR